MRYFKSNTQETTLVSTITNSATSMTVASTANYPTVPFTLVIDPDTVTQEIVEVTEVGVAGALTITRNIEGTGAQSHDAGAKVRHMVTARDLQEPQTHIAASAAVHGITGSVVGTTDGQTLTNKTLVSPTISGGSVAANSVSADTVTVTSSASLPANTTIGSVSAAELAVLDGITATTAEINHVDGVISNVQTQLNNKQPLDSDLTALAGLSTTGVVVRTGSGTATTRTLTAGSGITITNGDGVSGNPTISATAASVPTIKSGTKIVTPFSGSSSTATVTIGSADGYSGFSNVPDIVVTPSQALYIVGVSDVTTTSFDVTLRRYNDGNPTSGTSVTLRWIAVD